MDQRGSSGKLQDGAGSGFRVPCSAKMAHNTSVRMLSSQVNTREKQWIVPRDQPLDLLFFRAIFSELQKQAGDVEADMQEGQISYEAFQTSMERLFYILGDPQGFDAKQYDSNGDGFVTWTEFFRVYRQRDIRVRLRLCERIYLTVENADSSYLAQFISNLILLTIMASSVSFILSTMPACKLGTGSFCRPLKTVELCCLLLFIAEYLLRICTCWAVRSEMVDQGKLLETIVGFEAITFGNPLHRLLVFVVSPSNLIDLAAILPGIISRLSDAQGGAFVILRLVRLTRILRAFKSPAMSEAVRVISKTMQQSTQALYILAFNLMLGIVIFGSLMYMAEGGPELNAFNMGGRWNKDTQVFERQVGKTWDPDKQGWEIIWAESDFQSIPHACWWAMVTVATVGYGDQYPTTTLGKMVGVGTMLFSLVILALPVGVIGGTFSNVWEACDQEKKAQDVQLHRDLKFVALELSRLDPVVLSRLMLVEVWNDQDLHAADGACRPPPSTFMGEAKVRLDLQPHMPCSRVCTVKLSPNGEIAKRKISGRLSLKYEWFPEISSPSGNEVTCTTLDSSASSRGGKGEVQSVEPVDDDCANLSGTLKVTLLSAENLINLDTHRNGASSPYCMIFCYPSQGDEDGRSEPCIWRTPTARAELSPAWGVSHDFAFDWSSMKLDEAVGRGDYSPRAPSRSHSIESGAQRQQSTSAKMEELLSVARDLGSQLQQHKADVRQMRQSVQNLAQEVEQLPSRAAGGGAAAGGASGAGVLLPAPPATAVPPLLASSWAAGSADGQENAATGRGDGAPVLLPNCVPPGTLA